MRNRRSTDEQIIEVAQAFTTGLAVRRCERGRQRAAAIPVDRVSTRRQDVKGKR